MSEVLPGWATSEGALADWPVTPAYRDGADGWALAVPTGWSADPETLAEDLATEVLYRDPDGVGLLSVTVLPAADPTADLRDWVDPLVAVVGVPLVALVTEPPARLLQWGYEGWRDGWAAALRVDECHTYQGVVATGPGLGRLYAVLARRGTTSWRVVLLVPSASLPGTSEAEISGRDHVRAARTFAGLSLGS